MERYQKANISEKNFKFCASAAIKNNISLTKPEAIANACNKYFIHISSMIQFSIKFSRNKFHDSLSDKDINFFFIKPVDKTKIIFKLAVGPNSIQTKILELLISNDISNQLSELFNFNFCLVFFPQ